jgi:O-phospho-L-seryl-tRNASec:L-selenocysteinyl-tRNA synthase
MLFKRGVSGTRVVARGKEQTVAGHAFAGYGAHCDAYPHDYLTFAAALGTTESDVDEFILRLRGCIEEFRRL